MVYHHFASPPAVVAELRRVVRPGGVAILRTVTREILDAYGFLACFPEARAIDEARMPRRAALHGVFGAHGFRAVTGEIVSQRFAEDPDEYLARISRRALSSLAAIPDEAFARGLEALRAHCRRLPREPIVEPVEVLVFARGD